MLVQVATWYLASMAYLLRSCLLHGLCLFDSKLLGSGYILLAGQLAQDALWLAVRCVCGLMSACEVWGIDTMLLNHKGRLYAGAHDLKDKCLLWVDLRGLSLL